MRRGAAFLGVVLLLAAGDSARACVFDGKTLELPAAACPGGVLLAQTVFDKLLPFAHVKGSTKLKLYPASIDPGKANAAYWLTTGDVYINAAMLRDFGADELALAYALGHELGHGDPDQGSWWVMSRANPHVLEGYADARGLQTAAAAGYDVDALAQGMARFFKTVNPSNAHDLADTHPPMPARILQGKGFGKVLAATRDHSDPLSWKDFDGRGTVRASHLVTRAAVDRFDAALEPLRVGKRRPHPDNLLGRFFASRERGERHEAIRAALDHLVVPPPTRRSAELSYSRSAPGDRFLSTETLLTRYRLGSARYGNVAWFLSQVDKLPDSLKRRLGLLPESPDSGLGPRL